jgi:hypothetical protein
MENGGNFFTTKYFGIPGWMILAGVAVIGYMLLRNKSGSTPTNQTTGGGGSVKTGATTVRKGAIVINVKQGEGGHNPQPGPNPGGFGEYKSISVPKNMTLDALAKYMHWDPDTLSDIEGSPQPSGTYEGKTLTGKQKLKAGDTIDRPIS